MVAKGPKEGDVPVADSAPSCCLRKLWYGRALADEGPWQDQPQETVVVVVGGGLGDKEVGESISWW